MAADSILHDVAQARRLVYIAMLAVLVVGGPALWAAFNLADEKDQFHDAVLDGDEERACTMAKRLVTRFEGDPSERMRWALVQRSFCDAL